LVIGGHPNRPADGVQERSGPRLAAALRRLPSQIQDRLNKILKINWLDGYAAILTWLDVVSMVRAAFEGWRGAISINAASFRVSTAWLKARKTAEMEVAINRPPTKLRFPQGSEVLITGCPKFGTAEKSGLTNPKLEAETERPEPRRWRAVSGFPRS
jgi:hypothetical protein